MGQLRDMQNVLSDVHLDLENLNTDTKTSINQFSMPDVSGNDVSGNDVSGNDFSGLSNSQVTTYVRDHLKQTSEKVTKTIKELADKLAKGRGALTQKTGTDLDTHVKANMADFRESTIQEAYDRYMIVNRQKLEDEFHAENKFRTTVRGLKCRGTYSTHEQATARAQQLHKKDPHFSVYVAEVGQWLPWDPEPDDVQEQQYGNEQLNTLMKSYRENATKRDEFFEEEKRQKMAKAAAEVKASKAMRAQNKAPTFGPGSGEEVNDTSAVADPLFQSADLAMARKIEEASKITYA